MIIGYARVSTAEQHLGLQLEALKAAGCEKIFEDKASGAKTERPGLDKCLKFLQKGDILVVWKLDRLGRTLLQLVNVVSDFNKREIGFKVLTAPIDTTTPSGKLVFGIFAALAEFERELIRERVNAGIASAKGRGVKFGAPRKVEGEARRYAVQQLRAHDISRVAQDMGVSTRTLYRVLAEQNKGALLSKQREGNPDTSQPN